MKTHIRLSIAVFSAAITTINNRIRSGKIHPALVPEFQKLQREASIEVRNNTIALGFLRGKTMAQIEQPHRPYNEGHVSSVGLTKTKPDWDEIERLVREEGMNYFESKQQLLQKFAEFRDSAFPVDKCAA